MSVKKTSPIQTRFRQLSIDLKNENKSRYDIEKETGISRRSQKRFEDLLNKNGNLDVKKPDKTMWRNPNSKITEEYVEKVQTLIEENNDWKDIEYIDEMERLTDIKIPPSSFSRLMKKLKITRKNKTMLYEDAFTPVNLKRRLLFEEEHNPHSKKNPQQNIPPYLLVALMKVGLTL